MVQIFWISHRRAFAIVKHFFLECWCWNNHRPSVGFNRVLEQAMGILSRAQICIAEVVPEPDARTSGRT